MRGFRNHLTNVRERKKYVCYFVSLVIRRTFFRRELEIKKEKKRGGQGGAGGSLDNV